MSEAAIFKGTFSDFRIVKGRKVVQIMVEVPSEQANAALAALGGLPDPANPAWVAVARLDAKQAEQPKQIAAPDHKRWEDMPPAQQAAIRCGEAQFRDFLKHTVCDEKGWDAPNNADEAAQIIRWVCTIESRKELNSTPRAAAIWKQMDERFWLWSRGYQQ